MEVRACTLPAWNKPDPRPRKAPERENVMLHKNRTFGEPCPATSAEDLAEKLTEHTWTTCSAWSLGDLLFLNDSTCEDGAQEYAVVRSGKQIESITFGWCSYYKALEIICELESGRLGAEYGAVTPKYHPRGTNCGACA